MTENRYSPVIGLEVHAELLTQSKMFCGCAVVDSVTAEPNTSVCEICTGMPGTLPVINQRAVEYALRVALALRCEIAHTSVFARKNYFYPDLPKGYQISQYELPLAVNGELPIDVEDVKKTIRIRRVHLEEDTGKLDHRDGYSLVDYNRSGVPLLEIVSEPDLNSVEEVKAYSIALRSLLRYLEVNSGDMEKGVIRFEANVSVLEKGQTELGTRTEIKNLNSFRSMVRAVEYEIDRQSSILASGGEIQQETLGWDDALGETLSQRSKEEAHDYRYFPEPDLPPLEVSQTWIATIQSNLPELPFQKTERFVDELGLSQYTAGVLAADKSVAEYFEAALENDPSIPAEKIANWISTDLFALLNQSNISIDQASVMPEHISDLVSLVENGEVNTTSAKVALEHIFKHGGSPREVVNELNLAVIQDQDMLRTTIRSILETNPDQVQTYLSGKEGVSQWFFGQVMKKTSGRADPGTVQQLLSKELSDLKSRHEEDPSDV
ncbi:MAG: Asp-tRNA(Asn)/Glu-tRNA(Gln) amidotransferase subunit GatB [Anaerolineales bacterium]|jgi:aspartyl-tRNA(Asn)/glutamyl-tRNA(Gln) amidotransferase subunit B